MEDQTDLVSEHVLPLMSSLILVGGDWNMTGLFSHIFGIINPIDELIFFRGVA